MAFVKEINGRKAKEVGLILLRSTLILPKLSKLDFFCLQWEAAGRKCGVIRMVV